MESSVIKFPKESHYTVTHQCCVEIAENDLCAAKLINFFVSWHDYKLKKQSQIIRENQLAKQQGARDLQDTSLIQHHTTEELTKGLIGEYGKNNIAKALQILNKKGFVTTHPNPNPRYKADRTKHFLVHPEVIQAALDRWEQDTKFAEQQKDNNTDFSDPRTKTADPRTKTADPRTKIANVDGTGFQTALFDHLPKIEDPRTKIADHLPKIADHLPKIADPRTKIAEGQTKIADPPTKMANHYQDTIHDSFHDSFQENTPLPPDSSRSDESGGIFSRKENSDLVSPINPQREIPGEGDSELVLATYPDPQTQPSVPAEAEALTPLLVEVSNPELRPPQPPRCNTTEVVTERTPRKRVNPSGHDRKDAAIINWGIDNGLWESKQELVAFRIALIAYIPLASKFSWITEPIPYVRSLLKKASEGEDDAKATLIELWSRYTPQDGIAHPKASWLSLDERNQLQYTHWIGNDCQWDWQRENIPDWINKVLYQPESKPCKEMWAIWLKDRQADADREARWAKDRADRERQEAESRAEYELDPMTPEALAEIRVKLKAMSERIEAKKAAQKAARSSEIDSFFGGNAHGD